MCPALLCPETRLGLRCGVANRMANESEGERSGARDEARLVALTHELGAQLRRMRGAGPKIMQLLSMIELQRPG